MNSFQQNVTVAPLLVLKVQVAVIAALVALSTVAAATQYWFGFDEAHPYFDTVRLFWLDTEANVPTIYQVFALAACAVALYWLSRPSTGIEPPIRLRLKVLSLVFLALAIDEGAHVHELMGLYIDTFVLSDGSDSPLFNGTASWIFAAIIPGTLLLVFMLPLLRYLPARTRQLILASAALFVGGAVVIEKIGRLYAFNVGPQTITYGALATAEEAMEMLGAALFLYALLDYLAAIHAARHARDSAKESGVSPSVNVSVTGA